MKRYIALLRGINISGKHKIAMAELRNGFAMQGYDEVKTYLNSGNVIFSSDCDEKENIRGTIEAMIKKQFDLHIPVLVITKEELLDILSHAPLWWGNDDKAIYDNLILVLPPATCEDVHHEIKEPKEGLEMVEDYKTAIFWSFRRADYQKTNWWSKTASATISNQLTIRSANTIKKLVSM